MKTYPKRLNPPAFFRSIRWSGQWRAGLADFFGKFYRPICLPSPGIMQYTMGLIAMILLVSWLTSCGNSDARGTSDEMKTQLDELTQQRDQLDAQITSLKEQLQMTDPGQSAQSPKLVELGTIEHKPFFHYVELVGRVGDQNISYVAPSGMPGLIKSIYVKEGDRVKKGQLMLKLDNSVAMQQVNAIEVQMNSVQAQLDLAKSVYDRQQNLWDNNIGTEVQLLQARTAVETLEGQLMAIKANAQAALTQANQSNVYSNVNGLVDEVTAHIGETFNGNPLTGGYIRIVSDGDLKIQVNIPENYSGVIEEGALVNVQYAGGRKSFDGKIIFLSKVIDPTRLGFTAEIKVPANTTLRPNQMVKVKIMDYSVDEAVTVPLNVVQNDEKGQFVMVAVRQDDQWIAEKKHVVPGQLYNNSIEILSGLEPGDEVITGGFQGLYEGQPLETNNM